MIYAICLVLLGMGIGAFFGWQARSLKESLDNSDSKSLRDFEDFQRQFQRGNNGCY